MKQGPRNLKASFDDDSQDESYEPSGSEYSTDSQEVLSLSSDDEAVFNPHAALSEAQGAYASDYDEEYEVDSDGLYGDESSEEFDEHAFYEQNVNAKGKEKAQYHGKDEEDDYEPHEAQQSSINRDTLKELIAQFDKSKQQTDKKLLARYEDSVVKVFIHHKAYDYDSPWMPPQPVGASGSGFVINYEGKPYLMTNAHVADSTTLLQVRLADDAHKYPARVHTVDHDCDLALLEVDDPTFWAKAKPLEIGEMPHLRQDLQVFGFPMGGDEFCITQGQVSRIEVDGYAHSGVDLLQAQVSAAINPGNSGGPAIHEGKVLGVAFQGSSYGEALGYIIPPPVMTHFLKDATSPGPYKGFPDLAIDVQHMNNPKLRALSGMSEEQSGVRVKKVAPLSSAKGFLQTDDIILEIDGKQLKNDGTIALEYSKRLHYNHLINSKQIGETIHFKILREGKELEFELPLTNRSNTTYYAYKEYDKAPSYYIISGLVMMPLTDNFVEDASGFFSRVDIDLEQYSSKPKKEVGEEVVFIHTALATEKTKDTLGYQGSIIKEVNGKVIKNLRDAISAFESNQDKPHVITTKNGDKLVVDNLSPVENKAILKEFGIRKDRSSDLKRDPEFRPGCPEATALLASFERSKAQSAQNDEQARPSQKQKEKMSL